MKTKLNLAICFIILSAVASAFGQQAQEQSIRAKIDFPFYVEGSLLPPGVYDFTRDGMTEDFKVTSPDKKIFIASSLTRLSKAIHESAEDSHLVFDKVVDTYFLSEIWILGDDGFLFVATEGPHAHITLNIKR